MARKDMMVRYGRMGLVIAAFVLVGPWLLAPDPNRVACLPDGRTSPERGLNFMEAFPERPIVDLAGPGGAQDDPPRQKAWLRQAQRVGSSHPSRKPDT